MAYVTKEQVRTADDTLIAANGVTDTVLDNIIFAAGNLINDRLDADTTVNAYGETVYVDFQSDSETNDSYCLADQLTEIKAIVLLECRAQGTYVKEKDSENQVVMLDKGKPIFASSDFKDYKDSNELHNRALRQLQLLIDADKQYGNFIHTRMPQGLGGFVVVNKRPAGTKPMTLQELLERLE